MDQRPCGKQNTGSGKIFRQEPSLRDQPRCAISSLPKVVKLPYTEKIGLKSESKRVLMGHFSGYSISAIELLLVRPRGAPWWVTTYFPRSFSSRIFRFGARFESGCSLRNSSISVMAEEVSCWRM